MLPTKRIRSTRIRLLSILVVCFCIGSVFSVPETVSIASEAPLDRKNSEARQAMAHAERLRAEWKEDSLRQAIQQYDKAISIWTSVRDFAAAANATLKSGDVYFLFGEYKEALKRYQNAEALAVKAGDWLVQATALSRIGRLNSYVGNNTLAQKQLAKALDLFKGREANLNDNGANAYGEVLSSLAEVTYAQGDLVTSSELLEKALKLLENDQNGQARVHLFMGYIAGATRDPEKAAAQISKALELYRATKNKSGEGLALTTLGLSRTSKGDIDEASRLHREAIESFRAIGDRHSEAIAHNSLGQVYEVLSDHQLALDNYEQALRLFESIGSVEGVATSSFKIAQVNRKRGDLDQALAYLERSLKLSRAAGRRRSEADALNEIASVFVSQGRPELALRQYQEVYEFYRSIADRRGQATALSAYADLLFRDGQKQRALDAYRRALFLSREVGDTGILLTALYNFARVNLDLGFPEVALSSIKESLEIIEPLRANVGSPDFRATYFSGVRKHYDLCVRILMHLDRLRPGQGFAVQAFLINGEGRSRALNDLISESQVDLRKGASAEIIKRERELGASLRAMARYEWDLSLKGESAERAEVAERLAKLRSQYQEIQAHLRQQNPQLLTLERSVPTDLAQVQRELGDNNTLLLQYALDEERSYLWAVTSNSFQSYELPAGKDIEAAAREFYGAITARQANDQDYQAKVEAADKVYLETGRRLSEMLLKPVADQLKSKSLLFVTEGALQFISFDALPVPVSGAAQGMQEQVLLETNEISSLPSLSTLIAIRAMPSRIGSPERTVAVLADPVFNDNDDRVRREEKSSAIASAAPGPSLHPSVQQGVDRVMRDSGASRLVYSSEEADAILAAAPSGTAIVAKGFDATRETAMSSHVSQYQIVHFATHGFLDSEHPELSAIVLTMVDRNGVKTNGLMPLHDIYSLDLSAELTVLSACQTALGKDIKGEGPVGLTHSFISAGSKSVVASLWKVDDRATAALMRDFYESLLQEGMPTAKALRSAKLKMLRDKRWSAPYYWAGFVLQGEYTNRIAVDNSWRRHRVVLAFSLIVIAVGLVVVVLQIRRRRFTKTPRT